MNNYEEQILELKRRIEVLEKAENKRIRKRKMEIAFGIGKFLLVIILTLITLIAIKKDIKFKELFYKYIYEDSINFIIVTWICLYIWKLY